MHHFSFKTYLVHFSPSSSSSSSSLSIVYLFVPLNYRNMGVKTASSATSTDIDVQLNNNINSLRDEKISPTTKRSDSVPDYPVKTIEAKVCGPLYAELRDKKSLYHGISDDGIPVKIEYADTLYTCDASGKEISSNSPTVLCLHGAPGSHRDFKYMIKHLQQTGHRVVVPNFPSKFFLFLPANDLTVSDISLSCRHLSLFNPSFLPQVAKFSNSRVCQLILTSSDKNYEYASHTFRDVVTDCSFSSQPHDQFVILYFLLLSIEQHTSSLRKRDCFVTRHKKKRNTSKHSCLPSTSRRK